MLVLFAIICAPNDSVVKEISRLINMKFCSVPAFRLVIGAAVSLVVTVTAQEEYEFQIIRRGNDISIYCYLDSYYVVEIQSKEKNKTKALIQHSMITK